MFGRTLAGLSAAIAIGVSVSMPGASALGAGIGGIGAGGFSGGGIGAAAAHSIPGIPGGLPVNTMILETPRRSPERFRDLKLAGQIPAYPDTLPKGARIVRLRVNGMLIPMALDTEQGSADLQFDPTNDYARELYRSIFSKRIEVVGDANMRDRIVQTASNPTAHALEVEGYVFDRMSPYLVLRSVSDAK